MSEPALEIRPDLLESQCALLEAIRRPGTWLDGRERVALAAASRAALACPLCRARAEAVSPERAGGEHARDGAGADLPEALVEVAHRVRVDSGRLSRAWYERQRAAGLDTGTYVEAVGVVAMISGLDAFCRAAGLPPHPLPEPLPGAPSRHAPAGAKDVGAWVPLLAPEDATGPESDLYPSGFAPNIMRALSSVPAAVRELFPLMRSHYLTGPQMADPRAARRIDRLQMELVAARVSALNECFY